MRLTQFERVRHEEIALQVCRGTLALNDFTYDEVAASKALRQGLSGRLRFRLIVARSPGKYDFIAAACGPLARRGGAHHGQAGVERGALEDGLNHTKVGLHSEPLQPVVSVKLGGVWTIGAQRTIIDLAVRQVRHIRQVEEAGIIGIVTATVAVSWVGVRQARVVTR